MSHLVSKLFYSAPEAQSLLRRVPPILGCWPGYGVDRDRQRRVRNYGALAALTERAPLKWLLPTRTVWLRSYDHGLRRSPVSRPPA